MIPLRDQQLIRERFQRDLTSRVRVDYFTQKPTSLFVPGREECTYCEDVQTVLEELASLSERVALTVHGISEARPLAEELGVDKVPGIVIRGQANRPVRFFGAPLGNEFSVFLETLIDAAGGSVELQADTLKQLRRLRSDVKLQVFVTPTCPYCPGLARTALRLGLQNVRIKVDVVEVSEFPSVVQRYAVRAVPTTVIDDKLDLPGAMDEATLVQHLLRSAEGRPLPPGTRPGASTPVQTSASQSQPQTRPAGGSGLILPR